MFLPPPVSAVTPSAATPAVATSTPIAEAAAAATPSTGEKLDDTVATNCKKKKKGSSSNSSSSSGESPEIKGLVDYPSFNRTVDNCSDDERKDEETDESKDKNKEEDSIDELDDDDPLAICKTSEYSSIKWPPPDVQMVIDKMASYIIKNGEDFEAMVRSRSEWHCIFRIRICFWKVLNC